MRVVLHKSIIKICKSQKNLKLFNRCKCRSFNNNYYTARFHYYIISIYNKSQEIHLSYYKFTL